MLSGWHRQKGLAAMSNDFHENATKRSEDAKERLIRERAYQLWEADGAPEGKAEIYWHRARELVEAEEKPVVSVEQLNDLA
jgi:hypothetical protein